MPYVIGFIFGGTFVLLFNALWPLNPRKRQPLLLEVRFDLDGYNSAQRYVMGVRDSLTVGGQNSTTVKLKRAEANRLLLTFGRPQPMPTDGVRHDIAKETVS